MNVLNASAIIALTVALTGCGSSSGGATNPTLTSQQFAGGAYRVLSMATSSNSILFESTSAKAGQGNTPKSTACAGGGHVTVKSEQSASGNVQDVLDFNACLDDGGKKAEGQVIIEADCENLAANCGKAKAHYLGDDGGWSVTAPLGNGSVKTTRTGIISVDASSEQLSIVNDVEVHAVNQSSGRSSFVNNGLTITVSEGEGGSQFFIAGQAVLSYTPAEEACPTSTFDVKTTAPLQYSRDEGKQFSITSGELVLNEVDTGEQAIVRILSGKLQVKKAGSDIFQTVPLGDIKNCLVVGV